MSRERLAFGEQPTGRMDRRISAEGVPVCMIAGPRSWDVENWIRDIRDELSGSVPPIAAEIDWCMSIGRARIYAVGDVATAVHIMRSRIDDLNRIYRESEEQRNSPSGVSDMQILWTYGESP